MKFQYSKLKKTFVILLFSFLSLPFLNPTYSHDLNLPEYSNNKKVLIEIKKEKDPNFSSDEIGESPLVEKLIYKIKENYYKDIDVREMVGLSIEEIMASLDQYSSLKKIEPSSLDFIRGFDRDDTISDTRVINDNIGYIKIMHFGRRTKEGFKRAMMDVKEIDLRGLIIDIRDNPGGSLEEAVQIMQYFIPEGRLLATVSGKGQTKYFSNTNEEYEYPLVILINDNTASCAEIFAATLRYYKKATLVGINSYGKGAIQKTFPLDHNHTLILTIGECYPADGTVLQDSDIKPDYIIDGDEEQITFAIEFIEKMFTQ
ncbi:MAG: S41 family peptidase [Candidatus Scalinduaceae bacterium]